MADISVITATYNLISAGREETFKQSFDSVQTQKHPSIEHVIVDGDSKDGTHALIKDLIEKTSRSEKRKSIRWISEPDSGLYDAMNKGVELARGKYILFLASDDYLYDDEALPCVCKAMLKQPDYIYARQMSLFSDGSTRAWSRMSPQAVLNCMPFGFASLLFRRELIRHLGGFDTRFRIAADYDFVLKMIEQDATGVSVEELIAVFREGGISSNEGATADEVVAIWREHFSKYVDLSPYEDSELIHWHRMGQLPLKITRAIRSSLHASTGICSAAKYAYWKTLRKRLSFKSLRS